MSFFGKIWESFKSKPAEPENTEAENAVTEGTATENTAPEETATENTVTEDTESNDTVSENTASENIENTKAKSTETAAAETEVLNTETTDPAAVETEEQAAPVAEETPAAEETEPAETTEAEEAAPVAEQNPAAEETATTAAVEAAAVEAESAEAEETEPAEEAPTEAIETAEPAKAEETVPAEAAPAEAEEDAPAEAALTEAAEDTAPVEAAPTEALEAAEPAEAAVPSLETLEPADVFSYFRKIAAIPHGSFHTSALSDYLEGFAKEHDLSCVRDEMGNLILSRPASEGCENAEPIALQGHIDMVCEKDASNPIDMEKEAITLQTDGEWLWAEGTTLGGDDGIAVAIMLSLLADKTIKCPPLECIFTVDEEVGLLGAEALDLSTLKSRRMINLDSESEGVITASCAGGAEMICTLFGKRREKSGEVLEITVSGLRGGHSGERISYGRANADLLLARLLYRLEDEGKFCIVNLNGGLRDNAIPRDAKAEIVFTGKINRNKVKEVVAGFAADIKKEYSLTDPEIHLRAKWPAKGKKDLRIAFTRKDSKRLIRFLMALPNGVIEYSPSYREVPQTSLSLGIVKTMADGIRMHTMVRSSINSQKQMLLDRIHCIAEQFDVAVDQQGTYPAWELIEKSDFRDLAAEVYQKVTGKEPQVCVIHGGLECGLLAAKVPGLDCISLGPDMEEVHTPAERLNIPSSRRTYEYIKALLEVCAQA